MASLLFDSDFAREGLRCVDFMLIGDSITEYVGVRVAVAAVY